MVYHPWYNHICDLLFNTNTRLNRQWEPGSSPILLILLGVLAYLTFPGTNAVLFTLPTQKWWPFWYLRLVPGLGCSCGMWIWMMNVHAWDPFTEWDERIWDGRRFWGINQLPQAWSKLKSWSQRGLLIECEHHVEVVQVSVKDIPEGSAEGQLSMHSVPGILQGSDYNVWSYVAKWWSKVRWRTVMCVRSTQRLRAMPSEQ